VLSRAARIRAAGEEGFALVAAMGVLLVVLLLSAAALAEVDGDLLPERQGEERRRAYAAAEAGVSDFLSRLLRDNAYWTKCTDPANPALGRPADRAPRTFVPVAPGAAARFTVELLPANGFAECDPGDPRSVLDDATGTFRIRVTGTPSATSSVRRSLVTSFRPRGFVDFLYFTEYETSDPALGVLETHDLPTRRTHPNDGMPYPAWLQANCAGRHRKARLAAGWYVGQRRRPDGVWEGFAAECVRIQFAPGDEVRGPFHTNDDVLVCGNPVFGRGPKDVIEVNGEGQGWRAACSGGRPDVNHPGKGRAVRGDVGTWRAQAGHAGFPPSNEGLRADAEVRLKGPTRIVLDGTQMTVTGRDEAGRRLDGHSMPIPADGVVFVANDPSAGACQGYRPWSPHVVQPACGDVTVRGTYAANLTIGAENDVVVDGDVLRAGDAFMLGLIPNHWLRVAHPVTRSVAANGQLSCTNAAGTLRDVQIDAAILAVRNSFVVDNYDCGAPLGTLRVRGAIAQRYRGPVGTTRSGYTKVYEYDARLERRSPPRFINPVESPWVIASQSEQVPAT